MSRIDNAQTDYTMRPLNSFLFDCQFHSPNGGDLVFPSSTLKKLAYSVKAVKIPKMKPDSEVKSIQYGSFFVSFPFFSTGEKEMMITFYETDDLLISKIFYAMQAKHRWKPYAIYNNTTNVDLIVDVNIHDQHNKLKFNEYSLFHNTYSLVLESISPPRFSRTGTVQLLTVDATFNAVEFETEEFDKATERYSGFDAEDEMNKTIEEGGLDREPDVAGSMEDIQKRLKAFNEGLAQLAEADEKSNTSDFKLDKYELDNNYEKFAKKRKEQGANVMSKEDFEEMTKKNITSLGNKVGEFSSAIEKELGIKVVVKDVNDPKIHEVGKIGATSHVIGTKADLHLYRNDERIRPGDLTAEEVVQLQSLLEFHGLKSNLEYMEGGAGIWIDAELKEAVVDTKSGETTSKKSNRSWTGETGEVFVKAKNGDDYKIDLVTKKRIKAGDKSYQKQYEDARSKLRNKAEPQVKEQEAQILEDLKKSFQTDGVTH